MNHAEFIKKLKTLTHEKDIRTVSTKYFDDNLSTLEGRQLNETRKALRAAIIEAFPDKNKPTDGYYFTKSGKGSVERYEHLSLWYLSTNTQLRCLSSEELRQHYSNFCAGLSEDNETNKEAIAEYLQKVNELDAIPATELRVIGNKKYGVKNTGKLTKPELIYKILQSNPATKTAKEVKPETITEENTVTEITANIPAETKPETATELTLESMKIETLKLDADTQQKVQDALDYSGMSLADFIQKACTIYATTLTGKAKQFDSDLSEVETQELLSAKYKTHPGRAREMVKRAIQAIKIHNSEMVSETGDRWHINQTAIQSLTGSKPQTVKEILADYQDDINSHNENYELTAYLNRKADKRKIEDVIDVVALVPNGIE
ncbi:Rho termination factor N-terminal domain-containing protein [Anabaena sp. UHCC 0204]|uniref:Rho termination factor N-terminal domain-containing protein n=1 Tax=Anabaena sp. UHCC 0204 TaxID=2590009 RepID=UPI0015808916|nr:Rho termination factor N-terminal domain-containing protein [Anabaena sp. UHCC 0204]MTJ10795.1 hypothetical protein [Anabaena sp. UHCC 0204]